MVVALEHDKSRARELVRSDVREEFYKASGAGGQHRNKTQSAVKLTHTPTGVTAISADERSQHQNREIAWKRLTERVTSAAHEERLSENADVKASQFKLDNAWSWVAYADEVRTPYGKRMAMKRALKGDLRRILA